MLQRNCTTSFILCKMFFCTKRTTKSWKMICRKCTNCYVHLYLNFFFPILTLNDLEQTSVSRRLYKNFYSLIAISMLYVLWYKNRNVDVTLKVTKGHQSIQQEYIWLPISCLYMSFNIYEILPHVYALELTWQQMTLTSPSVQSTSVAWEVCFMNVFKIRNPILPCVSWLAM